MISKYCSFALNVDSLKDRARNINSCRERPKTIFLAKLIFPKLSHICPFAQNVYSLVDKAKKLTFKQKSIFMLKVYEIEQ